MTIAFAPPSMRASSGDLAIQVSPMGLMEMSNEEFEVHGLRISRYSTNWAHYLGHQHAMRREVGEPLPSFNYCQALSDYLVNFCFGRGVEFDTPRATAPVVKPLLTRIWEQDNDKATFLFECGQVGSVCGDTFVKIAYEDPFQDPSGRWHAGRLRLIPLNPAQCFPDWHPHDKHRMRRFKLKYRFWDTDHTGARSVFTYTEIITEVAIEEYVNNELISSRPNPLGIIPIVYVPNIAVAGSPWGRSDIGDIIGLNREYNEKAREISDIVNYHCLTEDTEALTPNGWKRHDELAPGDLIMALDPVTDEIRWQPLEAVNRFDFDGELTKWDNRIDAVSTDGHRWLVDRRHGRQAGGYVREFSTTEALGDLRYGSTIVVGGGVPAHFPTEQKYTDEFVETIGWLVTEGSVLTSGTMTNPACVIHQSETHNPNHVAAIRRLQSYWRAGGYVVTEQAVRENGVVGWRIGSDLTRELLAVAPNKALTPEFLSALTFRQAERLWETLLAADGSKDRNRDVWYQDDVGRRDGFQMLAAMLGKRTVSFVNNRGDGVVNVYRRNVIEAQATVARSEKVPYKGTVWCPTVPGGVWLARRNGNTYWTGNSAPLTVVTGARIAALEKGARRWLSIPKEATIQNLQAIVELDGPLEYMNVVKRGMHEMTGVPEQALGQVQPVSNTSGVALAIQYAPTMQRYRLKTNNWTVGLRRINEIALLTLFTREPQAIYWNEMEGYAPDADQLVQVDPLDPNTYETSVMWPEPLPVDQLVKLNEQAQKLEMGLQSKKGALRETGESDPEGKLAEIHKERMEDTTTQGALQLKQSAIGAAVMSMTGMMPGPDGSMMPIPPPPAEGEGGAEGASGGPSSFAPAANDQVMNELVTAAFGPKSGQYRNPTNRVAG